MMHQCIYPVSANPDYLPDKYFALYSIFRSIFKFMSRQERILKFLQQHFSPSILEVLDESHFHHVPKGAETHIKIVMVCSSFAHMKRIERHRLLNQLLQEELAKGLHALSMHLYSPQEWQKNHLTPNSPACKDGYGH